MVLRRRLALVLALAAFVLTAGTAWAGPPPPPPTLDVQPQGTGSGTVNVTNFTGTTVVSCVWNGSARSGDCSETFAAATQVTATAAPAAGSEFAGWMGSAGCPGTTGGSDGQTCTFTANPAAPVVLEPAFAPDVTAQITVTPQGGGTGTVTGVVPGPTPDIACVWNGSVRSGVCSADITDFPTTVELTAAATGVSSFAGWTAGTCPGTISGMGNTVCSVTVDDPSDLVNVQPAFQGPDLVAVLTVAPQGTGSGTVAGTAPGGAAVINCTWNGTAASGDCTEDVETGEGGSFALVATPNAGSTVAWTNCPQGGLSADGRTCTVTISGPNDDFTLVPAFAQVPGPPGCTVVGTEGDDNLSGTPGDDVICGLGGDDVILALAGNDRALGGGGNDRLVGGSGEDQLNGGADDDRVLGGADDDRVNGQSGDDVVAGQGGGDRVTGGTGNDQLTGGAGSDSMSGGAGSDRMSGGAGGDSATGGTGPDVLAGGIGSDRLIGGPGFDRAFGQAGADFCIAEQESSC